jgi:hypothetical protein
MFVGMVAAVAVCLADGSGKDAAGIKGWLVMDEGRTKPLLSAQSKDARLLSMEPDNRFEESHGEQKSGVPACRRPGEVFPAEDTTHGCKYVQCSSSMDNALYRRRREDNKFHDTREKESNTRENVS